MVFKYFAYGSNLLLPRLQAGGSHSAQFLQIAKLEDHRLIFCGKSGSWGGGTCTIQPVNEDHVWGVVYTIDDWDRPALDRQEAVHLGMYRPLNVTVYTPDGEDISCLTYMKTDSGGHQELASPSPYYKHVIVQGAIRSQLPKWYIARLEAIETNDYRGGSEVYDKVVEQCLAVNVHLPKIVA